MEKCADDTPALERLLATEHAFSRRALTSIREAFLEYLAEGSRVLEPVPVPGREFYAAAKENSDKLEWYPALAELSASQDLGITAGPWVYTPAAGGAPRHGHYLTVWKRDATCRWRVEFDGGISHGAPIQAEPRASADPPGRLAPHPPPQDLVAQDAAGESVRAFQETCSEDGFPAALRTYARTADFRFFTDGELPMDLAAANRRLSALAVVGTWREDARGRSSDSGLVYTVGVLKDPQQRSRYAYAAIWQYGPKVANWGLRILLINPVHG